MLEIIRDVLLVLAALASLIFFGLLVVVAWEVLALVRLVKSQTPPLVSTVQRTAGTIEGSVTFMSERAISPMVRWLSLIAAVLRFVQVLVGGRKG